MNKSNLINNFFLEEILGNYEILFKTMKNFGKSLKIREIMGNKGNYGKLWDIMGNYGNLLVP
jgi:hypothetical protein